MNRAELYINRRNTAVFILQRPITIALLPTIRSKTSAGGVKMLSGVPRPLQTFRLLEQVAAYQNTPGVLLAQDGQQRRVRHQLLGLWDSVMEIGDHWFGADGDRYEVADLLPYNEFERRGQVIQYGR